MSQHDLDEAMACVNQAISSPHGDDVDALADAILAVIRHLRSLPPEPKVETGEGEPEDCHTCGHERGNHEDDEDCRLCHCSAFMLTPDETPAKPHPPAALELTDEDLKALNRAVRAFEYHGGESPTAREALRKLNARAGSEGARVEALFPCAGCSGTIEASNRYALPGDAFDGKWFHKQCARVAWEQAPPAASETAKCSCVWQTQGGAGKPDPECPIHGSGARPSPETIEPTAWMRRIGEEIYSIVAEGDPSPRPARLGQRVCTEIAVALVTRLGIAEPAPAISKTETAGGADASETDGIFRMYAHAARDNGASWNGLLPETKEWYARCYRFVRAESEQRVRELERELEGERWARVETARLATGDLADKNKSICSLEQQLATLKAEKEFLDLELARQESLAHGYTSELAELKTAKEAAEARVADWTPIVEWAAAWFNGQRDTLTQYKSAGKACVAYRQAQSPENSK